MSSSISLKKPPHELKRTPHFKRFFLLYLLVFIIIFGLIGSFWVTGNIFYARYVNFINELQNATGQSIQIKDYKKGLFHSSAKLIITVDTGESFLPNPGFIIDQTISHGPLVYDTAHNSYKLAIGTIQSNVAFASSTKNLTSTFQFLTISSLFTLGNEYINYFNILPISSFLPNNFVKWDGLSGNINISLKNNQMNHVTGEASAKPFSAAYEADSFTLSGFNANSDMTANTLGLWDGTQTISISDLNIMANSHQYSLNRFKHTSTFMTKMPNSSNYTIQLSIGQIVVPDLTINSLQMEMSVLDINAKGLVELASYLKNLKDANANNVNKIYFLNLIVPSTNINVNFSADTAFGDTIFGKVTFNQKIDWPPNVALPKTQDELTKHVRMHAVIVLPIKLVEYFFIQRFDKMPQTTAPTTDTEGPSLESLQNKVQQLQSDNTIATSTKIQILNMLKTNPSSNDFSYYLDQLVIMNSIPKDVAESLKEQYKQVETVTQSASALNGSAPIPPPEPKQPPTSRELALEQINNYKNMGYLVPQGDNYMMTIDFENAELKINGKIQNIPPVNPSGMNQPAVNQPAVNQPEMNQPAVNQPEMNQPAVNQPEMNQPAVNQPAVNQPIAQ
jgi:hypothetical protein